MNPTTAPVAIRMGRISRTKTHSTKTDEKTSRYGVRRMGVSESQQETLVVSASNRVYKPHVAQFPELHVEQLLPPPARAA